MKPLAKILPAALALGALAAIVGLVPQGDVAGAASAPPIAANTPFLASSNINASAARSFEILGPRNSLDRDDQSGSLLVANKTALADGRVLTASVFSVQEREQDPVNAHLKIDGIPVESGRASRTVFVRGTSVTGDLAPGAASAAVILAGYAVLLRTATARYATIAAQNGAEVVVSFLEGGPDNPIIIGSVFNQQFMAGMGIAQASLVAGPGAATLVNNLAGQLGLRNPCASLPGAPCDQFALTLDATTEGNLLVHMFQGNRPAPAGSTVTVCVQGKPFSAKTDNGGVARFDEPGDTIALNAQTEITGIMLQFVNGTALDVCTLQGTSCIS
jgi:hypothetical protein